MTRESGASLRGGAFQSNIVVALTSAAPVIRFTLDGSEPGTNSPVYTAPLVFTNTVLLQFRAFPTNGQPGELVAETYTLLETNLVDFNSNLPLVIINTFGRAILPGTNTLCSIRFINAATNHRAALMGPGDFDGRAAIKGRGYTSLRYPKRSFAFETHAPSGESIDVSILGFPRESDWILYAPYPDKTLMRDVLAYELSNKLGHYASRTRFVEVFVNDGAGKLSRTNYAGVYVLEEKIKRGGHRVAIRKLSPDHKAGQGITGGYIFKKDHLEEAGGEARAEVPGKSNPIASRFGLPSGPGGFPADPAAFAPVTSAEHLNAVSMITNFIAVTVTNTVGTSSVPVLVTGVPAVTIVETNSVVVTNFVSVTNLLAVTNVAVTSNAIIATNIAVAVTPMLVTNAFLATQSVAATNTVATTNPVDRVTAVVTTTASIITTTTYRTNFVAATNLVSITNITFATNLVARTNSVISTNLSVAAVPVLTTNSFLATNTHVYAPVQSPFLERLVDSGAGFVTGRSNAFFFVEPKHTKITREQRAWLTNHLNRFEEVLHSADFRNPTNGYAAYLDVDSFIDHHLFVEATKNIDGFRFSTFFTKDRDGKIRMEPIWDWNLSWGNARGKQGALYDRWYWPQLDDRQYSWFRRLFEDPDFAQRYVDRWATWRTNQFAPAAIVARIDEMTAQLKEAAARNFERWPILGSAVGPEPFAGNTWEEDVAYLKSWVTNRIAWMDAQFVAAPLASVPAGNVYGAKSVAFAAPTGKIYFTTDGSDPRVSGGGISPAAKSYEAPLPLSAPMMTITARALREGRWSPRVAYRYLVQPTAGNAGG